MSSPELRVMSLNHIEALTDALSRAKAGDLGDNEFKMVVLRSLISLKESHVSLRSRLYDIEGGRYGEDYNSADLTVSGELSVSSCSYK